MTARAGKRHAGLQARKARGGLIAAVRPGTIGAEVGIEPGDRLLAINGHPLRDVIDYEYYAADDVLRCEVARDGQVHTLAFERDLRESLGLEFAQPLFDALRLCNNRCPFCFVQQMPSGLRHTLYLHDDDYRLSFLAGNFVTLTNLTEDDWQRIAQQRLTPLYVSVHATQPEVRRRVLGNPNAPDILPQLRRLGDLRVEVHAQIVITPGVNDGAELERSIVQLAGYRSTVRSLALVPVGLTRFHGAGLRAVSPDEARAIVDSALATSKRSRRLHRGTWLYPADELLLLAGHDVPGASFYDDDAQRENGVGLVRELLDDWRRVTHRVARGRFVGKRATLVCGRAIAPTLERLAGELNQLTGVSVQVIGVANRFFGETVTVSGLLTGADVLNALQGCELGDWLFLPRVMFGEEGLCTLDDITLQDLATDVGRPVACVSRLSEVVRFLSRRESTARRAVALPVGL